MGCVTLSPVHTPVFSLFICRSMSDLNEAACMYSSTARLCGASEAATCAASGCSGEMTTYETPISVSGRVVKARSAAPSASVKAISAPSERPIHARCIATVPSGQSTPSSSRASSSAMAVICNTHCRNGIRCTGKSPRSLFPSMTSSLASTVPRSAHQFTDTSDWKASPLRNSCRKIHWVHLTYASSVVASSRSQSYEKPSDLSCRLKLAIFCLVVTAGCVPVATACCSAGSPNESHPIGWSTSKSRIRQYLAMMSDAVYPSGCPTCKPAPDG
mmetsp:Transcript_27935/g.65201  ORF Transcript_27935/g.65201 Transcript_27935/m.65201 type:complete len:273 (-) Transcript_27935:352-1170(-)